MKYKDFKTMSNEEMKLVKGGNPPEGTLACNGRLIFVAGGGNCADPAYAAANPNLCGGGSGQAPCSGTISDCGYMGAVCCGTCYVIHVTES